MKNAISSMTDGEVRSRLDAIERYNDHFAKETDEKGQSLAHHMVSPRQLWNIMTREWKVNPRDFGIAEPPPPEWPQRKDKPEAQGADPGW